MNLKNVLCFAILFLLSCKNQSNKITYRDKKLYADSTMIFEWDSALWKTKSNPLMGDLYVNNRSAIAQMILDTNSSEIDIKCCAKETLKIGDFVFLGMKQHEDIPHTAIFDTYFDLVDSGCGFSQGYLEEIDLKRKEVYYRVKKYSTP